MLPGVHRRRSAARARGARLPVARRHAAHGARRWTGSQPASASWCANHASYLDGLVFTAALPPRFGFVIKREMSAVPLAGLLPAPHRLGVRRAVRPHRGAADARRVLRNARERSLAGVLSRGHLHPHPGPAEVPHRRLRHRRASRLSGHPGGGARHARARCRRAAGCRAPGRIEVEILPPLEPLPQARRAFDPRR